MQTKLDDDVMNDIYASMDRTDLNKKDFTIKILENIRTPTSSNDTLEHECVKFKITHLPSSTSKEYIEGSGNDILITLCRDIETKKFP